MSLLWTLTTKAVICAGLYIRWTPHPVIVTVGDNRDYIRVLLYSYDTTITGSGVLLKSIRVSLRIDAPLIMKSKHFQLKGVYSTSL